MGNRATCPGCDSTTSGVWAALVDGEPCPYCGLSASAIVEVGEVRTKRGDQELKDRLAAALVRADRAEVERDVLRRAAATVVRETQWALDEIASR